MQDSPICPPTKDPESTVVDSVRAGHQSLTFKDHSGCPGVRQGTRWLASQEDEKCVYF